MTWLITILTNVINFLHNTRFPFLNANIFDVLLGVFIVGTLIHFFIPESEDDD